VIGGSQQGRQVIDTIIERGEHEVVGVLDRALPVGSSVSGQPVLGRDDELRAVAESSRADAFVVAIGDNAVRGRLVRRAMKECPALEPVGVVHPGALIARSAQLGPSSIVMAGAIISNDCVIGTGVLLGTKASVDHDGRVDDFASLAPGATTGGVVRVGRYTAVGLGANVVHGVTIGEHTVVGAGALVLSDVPARVVAFGAPACVQRSRDEGEAYLGRSGAPTDRR
jgi:sugar O-acyltransferase (sialic acid O-acetyltransferase NeuD family)